MQINPENYLQCSQQFRPPILPNGDGTTHVSDSACPSPQIVRSTCVGFIFLRWWAISPSGEMNDWPIYKLPMTAHSQHYCRDQALSTFLTYRRLFHYNQEPQTFLPSSRQLGFASFDSSPVATSSPCSRV